VREKETKKEKGTRLNRPNISGGATVRGRERRCMGFHGICVGFLHVVFGTFFPWTQSHPSDGFNCTSWIFKRVLSNAAMTLFVQFTTYV
jgi:hypothetical protein